MSAQAHLFTHRDDKRLGPMADGAPYTAWQLAVIEEWHRRHPKPLMSEYGAHNALVPSGCRCLRCKGDAVSFPPESTNDAEDHGYALCPRCSPPDGFKGHDGLLLGRCEACGDLEWMPGGRGRCGMCVHAICTQREDP